MPHTTFQLSEQDIASYLLHNPDFFERHKSLLTSIQLVSSSGQRVINLQERQAEMLRNKVRMLEQQLTDMAYHNHVNSTTASQLLLWAAHLFLHADPATLPERICQDMRNVFDVPQAAIRIWGARPEWHDHAFTQGVSDNTRIFVSSLTAPYCGGNVGVEATRWLETPAQVASQALIPLRLPGIIREAALPAEALEQATFGLLVLASHDSQRYASDMGTEYLQRIGDIVSVVLSRLLPVEQLQAYTGHHSAIIPDSSTAQLTSASEAATSDIDINGPLPTLITPYDA